jgi:hypothetical protein
MADVLGFDLGTMATSTLNTGGSAIILIICVLAAVAVFLMIKRAMKYDTPVEIIEIDKSGIVYTKDVGGIFFIKQQRAFWLRKHKVGMNPDTVPYVRTLGKNSRLKFWMKQKQVFVFQTGFKEFAYIDPVVKDDRIQLRIGDADVSWAINTFEIAKKMQIKEWYTDVLPYIPLIIVGIIMLIIVIYMFKSFPEIKELISAVGETATKLGDAAEKCNAGSIIVGQ